MLLKTLMGAGALALSSLWMGPSAATPEADQDGRYSIDPGHSVALFRVQHLGAANFYGRFNEVTGTILVDHETPADMMVRIKIPTDSVDTNDENRDEHLKGPDFFDSKQFPELSFESTGVEKVKDGVLSITGDLTLHGVTKEITFEAQHTGAGEMSERFGYRTGYEAQFTIKRDDFGISFMPGALGEEVLVIISLEASKG